VISHYLTLHSVNDRMTNGQPIGKFSQAGGRHIIEHFSGGREEGLQKPHAIFPVPDEKGLPQ